jgi:3-methyladenine DNA glycosylase AlkD
MRTEVFATAIADEIEAQVRSLPAGTVPALRTIRREFSARLRDEPPELVLAVAIELIRRRRNVHRFIPVIADELVAARRDVMRLLTRGSVEALGKGLSSWDEVDSFACTVSGSAWRDGQIDDATIAAWAASEDRWWRRAALVSTVPLNLKSRGGAGDARRTLWVCDLLLADRDDMVVKAMSWALRALAVRDPAAVRAYLNEHDNELAPRVKREVKTKLDTGLKNRARVQC